MSVVEKKIGKEMDNYRYEIISYTGEKSFHNLKIEKIQDGELDFLYNIIIPKSALDAKCNNVLFDISKNAKIPGFRPGKVPLTMIKKKYLNDAMHDAKKMLLEDTYSKIMSSEKIKILSSPVIKDVDFSSDDIKFSIELSIQPEITNPDISNMEVEFFQSVVSESDIDSALDKLREENKDLVDVPEDCVSKIGNKIFYNIIVECDGNVLDDLSMSDTSIILGEKTDIDGFGDQLIGLKVGDEKSFSLEIGNDSKYKEMIGKICNFKVSVIRVCDLIIADLDDNFAKKFEVETLEKLREYTKIMLEDTLSKFENTILKKKILDELEKYCDFPYSARMLDNEYNLLKNNNNNNEESNLSDEEYMQLAIRRIKLGMIIVLISEINSIIVTEHDIKKEIMDIVINFPKYARNSMYDMYINAVNKSSEIRSSLTSAALERKVIDFLRNTIKLNKKEVDFESIKNIYENLGKALSK